MVRSRWSLTVVIPSAIYEDSQDTFALAKQVNWWGTDRGPVISLSYNRLITN